MLSGGCRGFLESTFVCFPEKVHDGRPEDYGLQARDLFFETRDRVKLHGWLLVRDPQAPFLLWCHGNAGNISHRLENIALLQQSGLNVFIFDYRGYGKSGGSLSEPGFYRDAEAAWETLVREGPVPPSRVVLFGRSLGCAMAADLAVKVPAAGLILESGFPHLGAMARVHYPFVFSERFLCRTVRCPVTPETTENPDPGDPRRPGCHCPRTSRPTPFRGRTPTQAMVRN